MPQNDGGDDEQPTDKSLGSRICILVAKQQGDRILSFLRGSNKEGENMKSIIRKIIFPFVLIIALLMYIIAWPFLDKEESKEVIKDFLSFMWNGDFYD